MPTDKPRFLVTRTREFITDESAANGGVDRYEEQYSDVAMSLEETVKELRECSQLSSSPVQSPADLTGHDWASTESTQDQHTGEYESDSVFVREIKVNRCRPEYLFRLFKLAGLIGR